MEQINKLDFSKVYNALLPYLEGKQSYEEAFYNAYEEFCDIIVQAMQDYIDKNFVDVKDIALGDKNIFKGE